MNSFLPFLMGINNSPGMGLSTGKKEPSRCNHRNGTGLKHRFVDINKIITMSPTPGKWYVNNNLSNTVGGISNIRATDGGNIASFRSKDSKIGQYIDVNSERVVINYMENRVCPRFKVGFDIRNGISI